MLLFIWQLNMFENPRAKASRMNTSRGICLAPEMESSWNNLA